MATTCRVFDGMPDEDVPLLRELLSYDAVCPSSMTFVRNEIGQLFQYVPPSPMHWSRQGEWPFVLKEGDFKPDQRVLDAGSGWSVLKFALARRCRQLICAELDPESVHKAQFTIDLLGMNNITQVCADMRKLPFPDGWFDRVVCVSAIEHMPEGWLEAAQELLRVLRPGGRMLLTMDVRIGGDRTGDFYLDVPNARKILQLLDCPLPLQGHRLMGSKQLDDQIEIVVLLINYSKPE